jgi:hypothetical protein
MTCPIRDVVLACLLVFVVGPPSLARRARTQLRSPRCLPSPPAEQRRSRGRRAFRLRTRLSPAPYIGRPSRQRVVPNSSKSRIVTHVDLDTGSDGYRPAVSSLPSSHQVDRRHGLSGCLHTPCPSRPPTWPPPGGHSSCYPKFKGVLDGITAPSAAHYTTRLRFVCVCLVMSGYTYQLVCVLHNLLGSLSWIHSLARAG